MMTNTELLHYKTNGSFESFSLDADFLKGFSKATGLGSMQNQQIAGMVAKQMAEMAQQQQQDPNQQGNQQSQQGTQGGQQGQQQSQQGQQQGQQGQQPGQQGTQGGQQGQQPGQGGQQPGQGGMPGTQPGQMGFPGGQGGFPGGQGGIPGGQGGMPGGQGGFPGGQIGNQPGGQGGQGGMSGFPGGQGGMPGGQGGMPGGQTGFPGGQGASGGLGGPLKGKSPFEGPGGGGGTIMTNQDPNNKDYSSEGSGRREPFDAEAAKLGAKAVYDQKKFITDIDDNPNLAKDPKKTIQDYKDVISGVKSIIERSTNRSPHATTYDMGVEGHITRELAPKVNWRALLERFVSKGCEALMTYAKPDRRFVGRGDILPGPKFTDDMIKDMIIGIDTSGSITDAELAIAAGHIWNIYKKYNVRAEVAYWDTICTGGVELKSKTDITHLPASPHSGGTNVDCFFQWVNDRMKSGKSVGKGRRLDPSVLIIFTDGYFSTPTIRPKCGAEKVIWVLTTPSAFNAFQVPFGQKAMLNFNELD